jgi:hypothetical protein
MGVMDVNRILFCLSRNMGFAQNAQRGRKKLKGKRYKGEMLPLYPFTFCLSPGSYTGIVSGDREAGS